MNVSGNAKIKNKKRGSSLSCCLLKKAVKRSEMVMQMTALRIIQLEIWLKNPMKMQKLLREVVLRLV